jgi:hypothetical protein
MLGPGRLYMQQGEEWVAIGSMEASELHVIDPPGAGLVAPSLRGRTLRWSRQLSCRQTRQLAEALFPGWAWRYWDGPRARAEYDRRRRARRRRGRR